MWRGTHAAKARLLVIHTRNCGERGNIGTLAPPEIRGRGTGGAMGHCPNRPVSREAGNPAREEARFASTGAYASCPSCEPHHGDTSDSIFKLQPRTAVTRENASMATHHTISLTYREFSAKIQEGRLSQPTNQS
jgi:hypothetical protein